jgi:uncharacterized heparinase superfamily protein
MSLFSSIRLFQLYLLAGSPRVALELRGQDIPPPAIWPVSPAQGRKLLKRRFIFSGCDVEMAGRISWQVKEANTEWHNALYGFHWIQDVAAVQNTKIASSFVREYINSFVLESSEIGPEADAPEVAGERLFNWTYHRHFILKGGSKRFQRRYVKSLARHIWSLHRLVDTTSGEATIKLVKGLLSASAALPSLRLKTSPVLEQLEDSIELALLPDGAHRSTSPEQHLNTLKDLLEIQTLLQLRNQHSPRLNAYIEQMGTMLRFWCHGDGRLSLFNQSLMGDALNIARAIELSDNGESVPAHSRPSGFFRLEKKQLCLLLEGRKQDSLSRPSAGATSMEFSYGMERFVVNCGDYRGTSKMWHDVTASAAAHSTLSLEYESEAKIEDPYSLAELPEEQFTEDTTAQIAGTSTYIGGAHLRGLHERSIKLHLNGQHITGNDIFRISHVPDPEKKATLKLRFHLHPDIRCQRQKDGTILLTSVSGISWLFSSTLTQSTALEESVYLGYYGKPQRTLQIVISTEVTTTVTDLRWSFVLHDTN